MRSQDDTAGLGGGFRRISAGSEEDLRAARGTRGRGGREVTRTAGGEIGAGARRFIEKSPQDRQGCAGGSQKRQVENTHSAGTTINLNGDKRMDR